jgi:hypothetical protein
MAPERRGSKSDLYLTFYMSDPRDTSGLKQLGDAVVVPSQDPRAHAKQAPAQAVTFNYANGPATRNPRTDNVWRPVAGSRSGFHYIGGRGVLVLTLKDAAAQKAKHNIPDWVFAGSPAGLPWDKVIRTRDGAWHVFRDTSKTAIAGALDVLVQS